MAWCRQTWNIQTKHKHIIILPPPLISAHFNQQFTYHNRKLPWAKQLHQSGNQASLNHHFNPVIRTISQVWNGPASVCQHLLIVMVKQTNECGQDLLHSLERWCRILIATQVRQSPGDVPQVGRLLKGTKKVRLAVLECYRHLVVGSHHYSSDRCQVRDYTPPIPESGSKILPKI